jgi:hypothetical protein
VQPIFRDAKIFSPCLLQGENHAYITFLEVLHIRTSFTVGCVVLLRDMNLVIVEGGAKAQKKFRRLMLNRIKWSEGSKKHANSDDEGDKTAQNFCRLVWEVSIVSLN